MPFGGILNRYWKILMCVSEEIPDKMIKYLQKTEEARQFVEDDVDGKLWGNQKAIKKKNLRSYRIT